MTTIQPQQTMSVVFGVRPKRCLEMFAECIKEANRHGSDKWGVTLCSDRVRLNVGFVIVCTLSDGGIWFSFDKSCLGSAAYAVVDKEIQYWEWTPQYKYKVVPSISGTYTPPITPVHGNIWAEIRTMHFSFIGNVAAKFKNLRPSSKKSHSQDFMTYLRQELNDPTIPDPK